MADMARMSCVVTHSVNRLVFFCTIHTHIEYVNGQFRISYPRPLQNTIPLE